MRLILLLTALFFVTEGTFSQVKKSTGKKKTAAKSRSKSRKTSKLKTSNKTGGFDEMICYEDGPCTFSIVPGDSLVYEVSAAGKQYNLIVVPNKFTENTIADFNWLTTAPESKSGHVTISGKALKSSKRYLSSLPAGELKLNDGSFLWFCGDNFSEIIKKKTTISIDGNNAEIFFTPEEGDAISTLISYKGKPTELDGFIIQNKPEGEPDRKEMWVLNVTNNLLIFKADIGNGTMLLKEVRAKSFKK